MFTYIVEFSGKSPTAHPSEVGFDHSHNVPQTVRGNSQPGANTSYTAVGRCHIGVQSYLNTWNVDYIYHQATASHTVNRSVPLNPSYQSQCLEH